jgi:apolipoprotein N-acyltransferase
VAQSIKWRPETLRRSLDIYVTQSLQHPDADLVVWPETAVTAFADQLETRLLAPLEQVLRQRGQQLVMGVPMRDRHGHYNALLTLGADSREHYYKRHLVPFGEYVPLRPLLAPLVAWLAIPMDDFQRGDSATAPLLELAGVPVGVSICYEDLFAEEVRAALPTATLLLNVSNDAWFGDSLAPHQHLQIARMRALENARPLLRATNTGISAVIDADGAILQRSPQFAEHVLTADITPRQGLTPFSRLGELPLVALAVIVLVLLGRGAIRR